MALVLIVDDSPTDVHVMQTALEQSGFRTASAADGGEGIRKQLNDAYREAKANDDGNRVSLDELRADLAS